MTDEWPKIRSRRTTTISPWVGIIEREVEFAPGEPPQVYHAVAQQDYMAIVALTPDGRIPIVRQYRPDVEAFTWELPAGLIEIGEKPTDACRRELLEETGLPARTIRQLAEAASCTGRLSNRIYSFFVETGEPTADFRPEPGMQVELITPEAFVHLIKTREFIQQMHLGALMLAELHELLSLPH